MGQEQSLLGDRAGQSGLQAVEHDGFRIVSSASNAVGDDVSSDPAVRAVNALPLPYPVLPPPTVRDDVTSALSGAQVMNDLRLAFGSFLPVAVTGATNASEDTADAADAHTGTGEPVSNREGIQEVEVPANTPPKDAVLFSATGADDTMGSDELSARRTQERWARAMLDLAAVAEAVDEAGGGETFGEMLATQEHLFHRIRGARVTAERLQMAMLATEKEASRTRKALESLERLRMAAADVQDGLEAGVATANILGASHFADDDELRSFKDYLVAHPPNYEDRGN